MPNLIQQSKPENKIQKQYLKKKNQNPNPKKIKTSSFPLPNRERSGTESLENHSTPTTTVINPNQQQ